MEVLGLSGANRRHVERLHRAFSEPFSAEDAAGVLGLDMRRARRLVRYLADRGWLDRVRRGFYLPVPLDAYRSGEAHQDPWIVASVIFAPAYIGGWSAAEHWDLTEQIFLDVLVVTSKRPRDRTPTVGTTTFEVHSASPEKHFGLAPVWRTGHRVEVSDPTRTMVDLLADPAWGGGIRHVAEMLVEYVMGDHRDDDRLVAYGDRFGVGAVFKRLGYLLEELGVDADGLVGECLRRRTSGINELDPSVPARGRITTRWGIRGNVAIGQGTL